MKLDPLQKISTKPRSFTEAVIIGALSLIVFTVSATFNLFGQFITWVYRHNTWELDELFTVFIFLMFAIAVYAWRRHRELVTQTRMREEAEAEKAQLIPKLESALANVSTLRKLLPICASCKKVRDDKGYWSQLEVYMETHFQTRTDDGICPDCARTLYGNSFRKQRSAS